jgi:hypothetical protein
MNMEHFKRKLLTTLAMLPLLSSCKTSAADGAKPRTPSEKRLQGMGLTLVVDAVEGAEMLGLEFYADGRDIPFYAKSRMVKRNREIMSLPGGTVPETVRVTWRKKDESFWKDGRIRYGGEFAGDYTIPIASRIPDEVVKEIRKNGGGLRLKFRLNANGVFFGWDIERFEGGLPRHSMPGGDFREAGPAYGLPGELFFGAYFNPYTDTARVNPAAKPYLDSGEYFIPSRSAHIWRKGWYIDKDGRKVLTDF